jgi:hypothetical protein
MNAMNHFRAITHTFHKSSRTFTVGALALGVGLFAVAGNVQAAPYVWNNTTSDVWEDPNAWTPAGGPPGVSDTATFNSAATHTVTLTNDVTTLVMDVTVASGNSQTLTLNLAGNSLSLMQPGTTSPTALFWGDASGGTNTIFVASSTAAGKGLFVTNAASLRAVIGRSGQGIAIVTNGFVQIGAAGVSANQMILGNSAGPTSRGTLILSGPNTSWTNNAAMLIGNTAAAILNSLVISNSASLTQVGASITVGGAASSSNTFLMDTGARLFVTNNGALVGYANIGNGAGVNNRATVQGGATWDNGNAGFSIGGTGSNNVLTIADTASVVRVSSMNIAAGNSLVLTGGLLQVSIAVTNVSATIQGFGSIAGNVLYTNTGTLNTGTLTPGFGTSVGTLTFSNNLTLVSNSTTIMKLDKNQTPSNDVLNVAGALAEAGTVTINNVGLPLVGGDTFQLFTFGSKLGDFTVTNVPTLTGSLVWNTSQLGPQGIISVVLPPTITGPSGQATNVGATIVISTTVTGVPNPTLQWQFNGNNRVDGPNAWGSTNSGSATTTLTISNAQTNDSGSYCLIASNSGGAVTNCMSLTVSLGNSCPTIDGPTDQYTILGSNATFTASVAGIPTPTVQWQENGVDIPNATNTSVTIANVSFLQDDFSYSIIASNVVCTATNSARLHVVIPPAIQTPPQSVTVTNTQTACFTVLSTNGVPAPMYQWYFNNVAIPGATNATYCITSASPSNMGAYHVVIYNVAGSVTSADVTLTVNSTMIAVLTPANGATAVCYDTPLYLTFDRTPLSSGTGKINIYNSANTVTPVDTIDTHAGNLQPRAVAADSNGPFYLYPVIITSNTAAIYPDLDKLSSNQTYYVTVDPGTFTDTNGALFAGITDTNAWRFATKSAPATPNNLVVAADGSGDFCTVQGALDSLPTGNTTPTLVNVRNGTYTEFVDTKNKNNVTFRGQSRTGTIVQYLNNNVNNASTHTRMSFKVFSNDISIENMTVVNTTPQIGQQAEALMIESNVKRFIFNNAEVDSRQDTILANGVQQSQCYFKNCLVQGNYDYIWGGGNCYFTNCELRTIPTTSTYNLTAARTDFGPVGGSGFWAGAPNYASTFASNGMSFVNCQLTRASTTVSNITLAGSNGTEDGLVAFINCNIDTSNNNGYIIPSSTVLSNELVWEFGNSNLDNTASVTFGTANPPLTNGDARLVAALDPTIWLSGWAPQLAPNILTNPVSLTVAEGQPASFSVVATGIPEPVYQWLKGASILAGQTNATLSIVAAGPDDIGTYSVIVSNAAGTVTSSSATLTVTGLSAFEQWQLLHFGCSSCPQAAASADPDGDGQNNMAEFLAGTDPNNAGSYMHILSVARQGGDMAITWETVGGLTNILQATSGDADGNYTNNFSDIVTNIIAGSGDVTNTYVDTGGATGATRYYRILLLP